MIWDSEKDKLFLEAIELYGMENAKEIKKHLGVKSLSMKEIKNRKKVLLAEKEKSHVDLVKENLEVAASKVTSKQFNSPLPVGNVKQKLAQFQEKRKDGRVILPAKSVKARAAALNSRSELGSAKFKQLTPLPQRKYAVKTIVSKIDKEQVMESPLIDAKETNNESPFMTPSRKAAVTARKVTTKRTGSGRLLRTFQEEVIVPVEKASDEAVESEAKVQDSEVKSTIAKAKESVENAYGENSMPTTPTKEAQTLPTTPEKEVKTPKLSVRRSTRNTPKVETPIPPALKPAYAAITASPLRKVIFTRVESQTTSKSTKPKRKRDEDFDLGFSVDTENTPKRACVNDDGSVGKAVFKAPPLQTWLDRSMSKISRTLFGLQ